MIQSIGVIGGGQLGRMFALVAKRMGYNVVTLDPTEHSPCGQVSDEQIVARYDDFDAIDLLGSKTDVVTYEFENIAIDSVRRLEARGYTVTPGSDVLRITQDRLLEKRFLRDIGIAVADFAEINGTDDVREAGRRIAWPAILKTVRGGYDGKGQWRAQNGNDAEKALAESGSLRLILEREVQFVKELGVVATRDQNDDIETFPVTENVHDRGILAMALAPARIGADVASKARRMATIIGERLRIVGTYCVEFFLTADDELLVNEIAPRPHNSGHYTIDAMVCSQYEQHVRAICDLPLAPPRALSNAVMMNILGTGTGNNLTGVPQLLSEPSIVLHLYGKKHAVTRRKMGHFTVLCDNIEDGIAKAEVGLAKLSWKTKPAVV
ncbi:MAG: 5-(carboxyamino)imidazole ribonucleotide synthase [Candidatus Meridianibacter frigidus]|nr:MAG: 5-(carboxyamino)imidazole ribonucleotide synthase [Candidatus Eremiobacteraeota bacterium]